MERFFTPFLPRRQLPQLYLQTVAQVLVPDKGWFLVPAPSSDSGTSPRPRVGSISSRISAATSEGTGDNASTPLAPASPRRVD